jgi:hypothetical protein
MLALVAPALRPAASQNLDEFASTLDALARRECMIVIDCSELRSLSIAAARMLERVSRHTMVRLTNAAPAVCLLATVFDVTAEPRHRDGNRHAVELVPVVNSRAARSFNADGPNGNVRPAAESVDARRIRAGRCALSVRTSSAP